MSAASVESSTSSKKKRTRLEAWLTAGKKDWYCQYPKGVEMDCVPQYVQAGINPREDWPKYKVRIVQEASNYEQGKRRFDRLLGGENAFVSDLRSMDQLPNPEKNGDGNNLGHLDENLDKNQRNDSDKNQRNDSDKNQRNDSDKNQKIDSDKNQRNDSDTTKSLSAEEAENSDDGIDEQASDSKSESSDDSASKSRSASPEISSRYKPKENEKRGKAKSAAAAKRQDNRQLEPNAVTKAEVETQMKKMQEAICKKIEILKKSWLNELRHQFRELAPSENFRAVGEALNTCQKTLETNFPVEEKQEFLNLEAALVENEEKYKALKTYMKLLQNGSKTVKDSVAQILSALLSKSQQLSFSGAGRKINGKGKENFSATQMFKAMSELLIEIHSCCSADVRSKTGKWLAGAGDRNRGKKERMLKALNNE